MDSVPDNSGFISVSLFLISLHASGEKAFHILYFLDFL